MSHSPKQQLNLTRRDFVHHLGAALVGLSSAQGVLAADKTSAAAQGFRKVEHTENTWIPLPDGVKLAARLWMPDDALQNPVPAILEYIPYRKRDHTRLIDDALHPHLAKRGYACVRVDLRGSGDSEGLLDDEYVKQEQDDALAVIAWLAKQPWCAGNVGMFGISWGGFGALQVAARRPEALKAVISHCASDDRYADDAHYRGGAVIQDMFTWGEFFLSEHALPPDPQIVGASWREVWKARLEHMDLDVATWLRHPHRDRFWEHGSICENYGDVTCPVYAIGGWADNYSNCVGRLLAGLKGPRKGLIGPWGHHYPHSATLGPQIDYISEAARWWDYWLKGVDTGIMDEPMLRVWMQEEPAWGQMAKVKGRWVAEPSWLSSRIAPRTYYLNASGLDSQAAAADETLVLKPLQTVGTTAPMGFGIDKTPLPADQRGDDERSLTFDSAPLDEAFEILGAPRVTLELAVDRPVALLAVRLNEVAPDGGSKLVTCGVLNLAHRDGHKNPAPLEGGRRYRVTVQLDDMAHRFQPGNRLRVAISSSYWPKVWPSPEPVTLSLFTAGARLELPLRPPNPQDAGLKPFARPSFFEQVPQMVPLEGGETKKKVDHDVATGTLTMETNNPLARFRLIATGTELSLAARLTTRIRDDDPASAEIEQWRTLGFSRGTWRVKTESLVRVTASKEDWFVNAQIKAFDDGRPIFERTWNEKIPRALV